MFEDSTTAQYEKIGEILLNEGLINDKQLEKSLAEQKEKKGRLGRIMVGLGYIVEESIAFALSRQMGIPFLSNEKLLSAHESIVGLVPEPFAKEHNLIPVGADDNTLQVAMADPDDIVAVDSLQKLTGRQIDTVFASKNGIIAAIDQLYVRIRKEDEVTEVYGDLQFFTESDEDEEGLVDMSKVETGIEDAPIVKLCNMMFAESIKERSTDIHIEMQDYNVSVRYRIDGVLQEAMTPPKTAHPGIISRIKILSRLNIAEKRLPQDGRFTIRAPGKEVDVRVSILPAVNGEKAVLRLLDKTGFAMNLETLGFEPEMLRIFRRWIVQPYGMLIISGPTGSGKSTTLYASLKEIKSPDDNITTVEDPVEYHLDGVNQVQVKPNIGLTFSTALRHILRQDPDKLLIGEIRDEETADIAVKFSLTGHLVFTTLHANDAPSTITRLIDIGVPPYLVGSCLNLIMAQRLVRRICLKCKEPYEPTDEQLEALELNNERGRAIKYFSGKGCVHCRDTGYHGRIGIFEMLEMRQNIRRLVFDNANQEDIREAALKQGMVSLREAGIMKIEQGITTIQEVLRSTVTEV
ncbi:pilus assembly protein PilB [candidate division LCP-89 bacterium B3_LCP]|uniref:Pilus assembly protein PilB n=1 Tax=candidate division LCP-89 bacterium B3_LCP TaxID=2012998 RepID=A0A532UYL4_UNCL8|nr:MAG: pilus assembly protein PilB [candidate division LCP-89 bacterium B3_LCP]